MKHTILMVLLALSAMGCKHQYWVFTPGHDLVITTGPETAEPETNKEIIFVLGINGMD